MRARVPLTDERRDWFGRAVGRGNRSSLLVVRTEEIGDYYALCADPSTGRVWFGDGDEYGLTPEQARRLAQSLLAAADHAEYGPGEWRNEEWHPIGEWEPAP